MILNRPLTASERRSSQRRHFLFSLLNGASYMCLGENVVILLAVHMAMPSSMIALLGSMIYLGHVALPLGLRQAGRVGVAACQADFWILRNMAALLIASSVFLAGIWQPLAWIAIILGSFLFYACRSAGCILATPLVGDIASQDEISAFLGLNNLYFYGSGTVALVAVAALTHSAEKGAWALFCVIVIGAMIGLVSSRVVRGINESGAVRDAARKPLLPGMKRVLRSRDVMKLICAQFGMNLTFLMLAPLAMLALKRGCGFSDTAALVCAIAQFFIGGLVSPIVGRIGKHIGPRLVFVASFAFFLAAAAILVLFPTCAPRAVAFAIAIVLFALIGIARLCAECSATAYFLMVCTDAEDVVPGSIAVQLLSGTGSGVLGPIAASGLLAASGRLAAKAEAVAGGAFCGAFGEFRFYFILALPVFVLCWLLILRLRTVIDEFRAKYGMRAVIHAFTPHLFHSRTT